ncbi:TVP38/TMEM64 family protein [Desulfotomaculum sp. 1211_IL3151]|uniref:TVP38/TMEM64 family protein n=1 Tax=Desulfotomaculum sp. 1211_IL3151 TaxID=3084055 RepID=UPI002FD98D6C
MIKKITLVILATSVIAAIIYFIGVHTLPAGSAHYFSDPENLAEYLRSFGAMTVVVCLALMILQTLFTPLPLFLLAGANGFIFGVAYGILLTLAGSMLGSTLAFYVARGFGRGFVSRYLKESYIHKVDEMSHREGPWVVFMARLIPVIPSSMISYVAGLSKMTFRGFFIATVVGKMPEIIIYTALGHSFSQAEGLATKVTILLILLTLLAWPLFAHKRKNRKDNHLKNFFFSKKPPKIPPIQ